MINTSKQVTNTLFFLISRKEEPVSVKNGLRNELNCGLASLRLAFERAFRYQKYIKVVRIPSKIKSDMHQASSHIPVFK